MGHAASTVQLPLQRNSLAMRPWLLLTPASLAVPHPCSPDCPSPLLPWLFLTPASLCPPGCSSPLHPCDPLAAPHPCSPDCSLPLHPWLLLAPASLRPSWLLLTLSPLYPLLLHTAQVERSSPQGGPGSAARRRRCPADTTEAGRTPVLERAQCSCVELASYIYRSSDMM